MSTNARLHASQHFVWSGELGENRIDLLDTQAFGKYYISRKAGTNGVYVVLSSARWWSAYVA